MQSWIRYRADNIMERWNLSQMYFRKWSSNGRCKQKQGEWSHLALYTCLRASFKDWARNSVNISLLAVTWVLQLIDLSGPEFLVPWIGSKWSEPQAKPRQQLRCFMGSVKRIRMIQGYKVWSVLLLEDKSVSLDEISVVWVIRFRTSAPVTSWQSLFPWIHAAIMMGVT